VLTAHEVYLPKPKLVVEGPGGVQASFDFRGGEEHPAVRMLTVTLTNDLDGTVYGWSSYLACLGARRAKARARRG
jgi:hypothetical protein